ncbi:MAG TPA: hypothetical protein VJ323_15995, partial [Bryobacteraceae bacterium]|nr:hypothetical protein [Bryobacteraceae bacterium]
GTLYIAGEQNNKKEFLKRFAGRTGPGGARSAAWNRDVLVIEMKTSCLLKTSRFMNHEKLL